MTRRDSKFVSVYNAAVDTIKFHQRHPLPNAPVKGHVALSRHTPLRRASQSHVWQPSHLRGVPDTISSHHLEAPKHHHQDGSCLVRIGSDSDNRHTEVARKRCKYICFDEAFLKNLERMQWDRNNSFVELIPIVLCTGIQ